MASGKEFSLKRDDTYIRILELILNNCKPGESLSEQDLGRLIGVSRTPIREALSKLEQEGLVRCVPRKGSFVAILTIHELHELFDIREALELYAIRKVAGRPDLLRLAKLQEEADRIFSLVDPEISLQEQYDAIAHLFYKLHRYIMEQAGNNRMLELFETMRRMWIFGGKFLIAPHITKQDVLGIYARFTEIIKTLGTRDPLASERAMRHDFSESRRLYFSAVPAPHTTVVSVGKINLPSARAKTSRAQKSPSIPGMRKTARLISGGETKNR